MKYHCVYDKQPLKFHVYPEVPPDISHDLFVWHFLSQSNIMSKNKTEKKENQSSENLATRSALLLSQKKYALVVVISFVLCASVGSLLTSNNESAVCHHHKITMYSKNINISFIIHTLSLLFFHLFLSIILKSTLGSINLCQFKEMFFGKTES